MFSFHKPGEPAMRVRFPRSRPYQALQAHARGQPVSLPDGLDEGGVLIDMALQPVEYVVEPYFPRGELIEIHGPHGNYKSTLALYATLAVATGTQWHGLAPTRSGKAAFVSLEDTTKVLAHRVQTFMAGRIFEDDEAAQCAMKALGRQNFRSLGRETAAALTLTKMARGQSETRHEVVEWFVTHCQGLDLLVVETAARLAPGPETNEALALLAFALEEIATRTGACVVLIRHVSKEQATSGKATSYGGRGGGAFADAARGVLSVARESDEKWSEVRVVHTKPYALGVRGPDLVWQPTDGVGGVFLEPVRGESTASDESAILRLLAEAGDEGLQARDLVHDSVRGGVGAADRRAKRRKALDALEAAGKVTKEGTRYRAVRR